MHVVQLTHYRRLRHFLVNTVFPTLGQLRLSGWQNIHFKNSTNWNSFIFFFGSNSFTLDLIVHVHLNTFYCF